MHRTGHHRVFRDLTLLISGVGIGSTLALLLAPTSGEDLRYAIGHRCERTVKKIGRRTEELRDRAEDFLDHARRAVNRRAGFVQTGRESRRRSA